METTQATINEWINKRWYAHIQGILFSHKNEWSSDICYDIDEAWKHYGE